MGVLVPPKRLEELWKWVLVRSQLLKKGEQASEMTQLVKWLATQPDDATQWLEKTDCHTCSLEYAPILTPYPTTQTNRQRNI